MMADDGLDGREWRMMVENNGEGYKNLQAFEPFVRSGDEAT
jgi:hypothetical protein